MTGYLPDTNVWVDHLRRGPSSTVTARLLAVPPGSVVLCTVVLGELLYGAIRSGSANEAGNRIEIGKLRVQYPMLAFDENAAEQYAVIRAYLSGLGIPIGPNDTMIAAIALANGKTLVTHNTAEFSRVPGLVLEDWQ